MINKLYREPLEHETYPGGTAWESPGDTIDWLESLIDEESLTPEEIEILERAIQHLEDYQTTIREFINKAEFKEIK